MDDFPLVLLLLLNFKVSNWKFSGNLCLDCQRVTLAVYSIKWMKVMISTCSIEFFVILNYPAVTNIFAVNQIIRYNGVFAVTKTPLFRYRGTSLKRGATVSFFAVQIYESSYVHFYYPLQIYYKLTTKRGQLLVGLIVQLVEHYTGIVEVMGWNPVQPWIFSGFNFTTDFVVYITAIINLVFMCSFRLDLNEEREKYLKSSSIEFHIIGPCKRMLNIT